MAVDPDDGDRGTEPEPFEHGGVGIARELDAVAHAPVGAQAVDVVWRRVEPGASASLGGS